MPTTSTAGSDWIPPGRNCGACGRRTCDEFTESVSKGEAELRSCPFYVPVKDATGPVMTAFRSGIDVVGAEYDFVLEPMPGEPSARKIVLPFRPDMVDIMDINPGDVVVGRPAGAGCPVQHVIRVLDADRVTGVITGHVVGPAYARDREVKDVRMYHMLGFEGKAVPVRREPCFGIRHRFLPGFCMMDRAHTGLVNMVIDKPWGIQIRIEDIVIL